LFLTGRYRELAQRWLWSGLGLALLVATPWHLAQTVRHGSIFWNEYIGFNVLQRAGRALFQETPITFYLESLWASNMPLALLLGAGLVHTAFQLWQHRPGAASRDPANWSSHLFIALWFLASALPLSLASTRIDHYFLPALPALAAAGALGLARLWPRHEALFPASMALAALLFFSGNAFHLTTPDYSPDQTRFANQIKAGPKPDARVVAVNHYELTLFYYLDTPVDMRTTDPRFFEIVDSAPILHRMGGVTLERPDELVANLAKSPFYALTSSASLPLLCGATGQHCRPEGPLTVTKGEHLMLISNVK
jgi:4-amino-4-deoxy-L-arabinose transferase-like glycosyltransferase